MRLRLFIICSVTPWILADTVNDGNKTTTESTPIETTTKAYKDETRRDAFLQLLKDNVDHASIPLIEHGTYNENIPGNGIELLSKEVTKIEDDNINILQHALREQAESNGICKNAEFLIKILTTMIPLLKNDVPESSKTSYILEILKDLLKTSPEVAEDYEVMYKINDLLQTLEKYHVKDFDSEHLLRTSNNTLRIPHGHKNVLIKYKMPHLQNSKCAAEILMVIKVVQEAIMRLMNNPVCKSKIIGTGVPFLSNVDILLKKLYLYSSLTPDQYPPNIDPNDFDVVYENIYPGSPYKNPSTAVLQFIPKVPSYLKIYQYPGSKVAEVLTDNILWSHKNKHIKGFEANQEIPILDVDLPENKLIHPSSQIKLLPYAPNILNVYEIDETPKTDIDIISKIPTFDNGVQAYPYLKPVNPINQPNSVKYYPLGDSSRETFKNPSIVEQGETDSIPNYNKFTILENMPTSPDDYKMPSDDSAISILDIDAFKDDIPLNQAARPSYDAYLPIEFEHPYHISDDGSGEINIGQGRPSTGFDLNLPIKIPELYLHHIPKGKLSPFQVIGNAETAYVEIGKNLNNPMLPFEDIGDETGNFYDSENMPTPDLGLDLPAKHSESPLHVYVPSISATASPFEVTGNKGTADIVIGENNPEYIYDLNYLVKKPTLPFDILSPHIKRPSKDPNKYDKSPNSSPFINGYPDLYPDIPSSFGEHRKPYEPKEPSDNYLLQTRPFMMPPFEFVEDRSEEIVISSSPKPLNLNQKIEEVLPFDYPQQLNDKPSSYPIEYHLPNMDDINYLYPSQPEYLEYFDIPKNSDFKNKAPSIQNQPKSPIPKIHPEELIPLYPYSPYQSNILPVPDYLEEPKLSPSIPKTFKLPSNNNVLPGYPEDDSLISYLPQEIVSKPHDVVSYGPNLQIENQYIIHNQNNIPYEDIQDSVEIFADNKIISTIRPPVKWKYNSIPNINSPELSHLSTYPDKKFLVIINDNIEVIEHKIPKSYLDSKIREQINIIKELMKLKKITVQEYVTILNQYEILIEYIKHSNIDDEILRELLLSMTNEGKLDLQNGKSNVVELTYLIKRPTPLIYQPYYYIKYRLPYTSFVTSVKTILASNPYLSKYPSQLYKTLIPMSKVAETSPDLESYGKSDIQKLIFNNGTLVGTKVIKGSDIGMYASLDKLKEINTDFTVKDLYKTIKNLDMELQSSENNDRPYAVGINPSMISNMNDLKFQLLQNNNGNAMDQITVKVNKKPTITKKITKITTKKFTSNKMIADILNQVNSLRSSKSSHEAENNSNELAEHDDKIRSEPNVESSLESHHQESNSNKLVEINSSDQAVPKTDNTVETHNNINQTTQANDKLAFDYVPMYSDNSVEHLNYYSKMNTASTNDVNAYSQEIFQLNKPNYSFQKFGTPPSLSMFDKLLEATVNAKKSSVITTPHSFDTNPELIKTKSSELITDEPKYVDSTWNIPPHGQSQSSIGEKLLDATLKAHDFKQLHNPNSPNIDQQPTYMLPGDSIYSNVNPYNANFDHREPSKIENSNSIKHSQTDSFGDSNNIYSNFDKTYQPYNPNNINPNFMTFSQQYKSVNPVDSYKYYNTYTIDNSNNFDKQYKPYSIDNLSHNLYNSGIKSSGYFVNYNKNLFNNMKYPILNYQKTSNAPFMFHPLSPIRTG